MRILRSYTIDTEIVKKLQKEDNASDLINCLLTEHFRKTDVKKMSAEELKKFIKIETAKRIFNKTMNEINNG